MVTCASDLRPAGHPWGERVWTSSHLHLTISPWGLWDINIGLEITSFPVFRPNQTLKYNHVTCWHHHVSCSPTHTCWSGWSLWIARGSSSSSEPVSTSNKPVHDLRCVSSEGEEEVGLHLKTFALCGDRFPVIAQVSLTHMKRCQTDFIWKLQTCWPITQRGLWCQRWGTMWQEVCLKQTDTTLHFPECLWMSAATVTTCCNNVDSGYLY